MSSDSDYTQDLLQASLGVGLELTDRLTVKLDDKDVTAVSSALTKALMRGFKMGAQAYKAGLEAKYPEQDFPNVSFLNPEGEEEDETDLWAEEYGDEQPPT